MNMKKAVLATGAAALAAGAALVCLTAPGTADPDKRAVFYGRNFANRGLHEPDKSVPENSIQSFLAAVEAGYGLKLDVRLSNDDRVVVFHDSNMKAICGVDEDIEEMAWSEIKKLKLYDTSEKPALLSEALSLVAGRVPVMIELKSGRRNSELCARTLELVRCYSWPVCIQSLNPFILGWFRTNAPDILRGQVTGSAHELKKETNCVCAFLVSRLLTNILTRPHMIAHSLTRKACTVKLCEAMGAMKVAWTAQDETKEDYNDAVIFEYFTPRVSFK